MNDTGSEATGSPSARDLETELQAYRRYGRPHAGRDSHLLVLTDLVPTPDADSGSFRLAQLLSLWQEIGFAVTLGCDRRLADLRYVEALERSRIEVIVGHDAILRHLRSHGHRYEAVVLSRPDVASDYLFEVRGLAMRARTIYDTVDLHWVRMERAADLDPSNAELRDRAGYYAKLEPFLAAACDVVLAITEQERSTLLSVNPALNVQVLPNVHPPASEGRDYADRRDLLFIGGFWHQPNEDAVCFFVAEVLPLILRELPDVVFNIVGSNVSDRVKALASPSVRVLGFVPDASPCFEENRVFVSPLRYGAGMKGKIGHSMSHNLPVVTTSIGAEGMQLVDGDNALIEDSPGAFAAAVVRLYSDERLWKTLALRGRQHIDRLFSPAAARDRLRAIFLTDPGESRHAP